MVSNPPLFQYIGDWKSDHRWGWGLYEMKSGDVFEGQWYDDQIDGMARSPPRRLAPLASPAPPAAEGAWPRVRAITAAEPAQSAGLSAGWRYRPRAGAGQVPVRRRLVLRGAVPVRRARRGAARGQGRRCHLLCAHASRPRGVRRPAAGFGAAARELSLARRLPVSPEQGRFSTKDGATEYNGQWKDGKRHGALSGRPDRRWRRPTPRVGRSPRSGSRKRTLGLGSISLLRRLRSGSIPRRRQARGRSIRAGISSIKDPGRTTCATGGAPADPLASVASPPLLPWQPRRRRLLVASGSPRRAVAGP